MLMSCRRLDGGRYHSLSHLSWMEFGYFWKLSMNDNVFWTSLEVVLMSLMSDLCHLTSPLPLRVFLSDLLGRESGRLCNSQMKSPQA